MKSLNLLLCYLHHSRARITNLMLTFNLQHMLKAKDGTREIGGVIRNRVETSIVLACYLHFKLDVFDTILDLYI